MRHRCLLGSQGKPTVAKSGAIGNLKIPANSKLELLLGHEFKRSSLVDALRICSGVLLTISKEEGELVMESPIFPLLLLGRKQDWVKHPKDTRRLSKSALSR